MYAVQIREGGLKFAPVVKQASPSSLSLVAGVAINAWEIVTRQLARLEAEEDLSFSAFLDRDVQELDAEERQQVFDYVEGFNAADAGQVSSLWVRLADEQTGQAQGIQRVCGGYSQILDYFLACGVPDH